MFDGHFYFSHVSTDFFTSSLLAPFRISNEAKWLLFIHSFVIDVKRFLKSCILDSHLNEGTKIKTTYDFADVPPIFILSVYVDFFPSKFGKTQITQIFPNKISQDTVCFSEELKTFPYSVLFHSFFFMLFTWHAFVLPFPFHPSHFSR